MLIVLFFRLLDLLLFFFKVLPLVACYKYLLYLPNINSHIFFLVLYDFVFIFKSLIHMVYKLNME